MVKSGITVESLPYDVVELIDLADGNIALDTSEDDFISRLRHRWHKHGYDIVLSDNDTITLDRIQQKLYG